MDNFSLWVKLFFLGFASGLVPAGLFYLVYTAFRSVRDAGEIIV